MVDPWIAGLWPCLQKHVKQKPKLKLSESLEREIYAPKPTLANTTGALLPASERSTPVPKVLVESTHSSPSINRSVKYGEEIPVDLTGLEKLSATGGSLSAIPKTPAPRVKVVGSDMASEIITPYTVYTAQIASAQCLTAPEAFKRTLLVTLKLDENWVKSLAPGDAVGIISPNSDQTVSAVLQRLSIADSEADRSILLSSIDSIRTYLLAK